MIHSSSPRLRLICGGMVLCCIGAMASQRAVAVPLDTGSAFGSLVQAIPENGWGRLNTNAFRDVWPDHADRNSIAGSRPNKVIQAWGSMAWDDNRGDLIFFGGGHANYSGNEVYRWRSSSLQWERASLPSRVVHPPDVSNNAYYETADGPDHSPVAAHTYDNQEFLSNLDRFVTLGGAGFNDGGGYKKQDPTNPGTFNFTGPYLWDPNKADPDKVGGQTGSAVDPTVEGGEMWQNRDTTAGFHVVNGTSDFTVENGNDVLYFERPSQGLWRHEFVDPDDPSQDIVSRVGAYWSTYGDQGTGAWDPTRKIYMRTMNSGSNPGFTMWDLDSGTVRNTKFDAVDQDGNVVTNFGGMRNVGMEFDPIRNRFVLWSGYNQIWELLPEDPAGTSWYVNEIQAPSGLNGVPDRDLMTSLYGSDWSFHGILGHWRYAPELDLFFGMFDSFSGDIWAYKPEAWEPVTLTSSSTSIPLPGTLLCLLTGTSVVLFRRRRACRV